MNHINALALLADYGVTGPVADRVLAVARSHGENAHPVDGGYLSVCFIGGEYTVVPRLEGKGS